MCVCSAQCVCVGVSIHGTSDSITESSWGDEWKSGEGRKDESGEEVGGGSEGGREDLEEGERRDEKRITVKGGGGFKGEVFHRTFFVAALDWTRVKQPRSVQTQQQSLKTQVWSPPLRDPWGARQGPAARFLQQRAEVEAGVS